MPLSELIEKYEEIAVAGIALPPRPRLPRRQ